MAFLKKLTGKLIVSCQALPGEPLHSSTIMAKMALAALQGGANGIRANSTADIRAIKKVVNLPIIGIVKRDYLDSEVFITPTLQEVRELIDLKVDMIALDATSRLRPNNQTLAALVEYVKTEAPDTELMADISTISEAVLAEELGFDCISTTLVGYTEETEGASLFDDDFKIIKELKEKLSIPIVAEGKLHTPLLAKEALSNGADLVVVGSAITRPQLITARFNEELQ